MLRNYYWALRPYLRNPTHIFKNIWWRLPRTPSAERHIFVVGAPRSGTTLMQVILAAHPRLCSFQGESTLFTWQDVFDENQSFFGLEKATQRRLLEETDGLAPFFDRVAELMRRRKEASRFVEKTPQHVHYLSAIGRHFPNADIVHMQRDGRDCFCSARDASVPHGENARSFARYWRRCIKARQRHEGGRILDVKYEMLTDEPESTMREVMAFLGEAFDPQQIAPNSRGKDRRAETEKFGRLSGPIDSSSQGRWRNELTVSEKATFREIAGVQLQQAEYPLR
jgi:hypothetical protein